MGLKAVSARVTNTRRLLFCVFPCTALVCLQSLPQQFLQSCCQWWAQLAWNWWRRSPVAHGSCLGAEQTLGASCGCAAPSLSAERSKRALEGRSVTLLRGTWNTTAWPNTAFMFPSVKQPQDSYYEILWSTKLKTRNTNLLLIRGDTEVLSSAGFYPNIAKCFMTFSKRHLFCVLFPCSSPLSLSESSFEALPFMLMLW